MSHFKATMHQIVFPSVYPFVRSSVRPSVCVRSTSRSDVDTAAIVVDVVRALRPCISLSVHSFVSNSI